MKRTISIAVIVLLSCLAASAINGQGKKVRILRLEVDGKPVQSSFKVDIIDGDKVFKTRTTDDGFFVPAEVVGKNVGVLVRFKKYVVTFFFVSPPRFETDWIVGVDTHPFATEHLEGADPAEVQVIYYIKSESGASPVLMTKVGKPKVTIKRMNDD